MIRLVMMLAGCEPAAQPEGPVALFRRDGGFWEAPMPSDHRLAVGPEAEGTVELTGFPGQEAEITAELVALLDGRARGFGRTSTIYLPFDRSLLGAALPGVSETVQAASAVQLIDVDPGSPEVGRRFPVVVSVMEGDGPSDPAHALALLPLQGVPLRAATRYAAVALSSLVDGVGDALRPAEATQQALAGQTPMGWTGAEVLAWRQTAEVLQGVGLAPGDVAGITVFTTQDPTRELGELVDRAREEGGLELAQAPVLTATWPGFCEYEGLVRAPVFQAGEPPYLAEGGGFAPGLGLQRWEDARLILTIPRGVSGQSVPAVVFIRTGAGGDRALIDRGARALPGQDVPGTGYANEFAAAGWAGVQIDGPLGGIRNPGGDEQFLIFNVANPEAMRDNLRQSAAELAILPDLLDQIRVDASACDAGAGSALALEPRALWGHSMGATIAPLVTWAQPRFQHLLLSGAGGSWIENVVYKRSPIEVRPIAAAMLGEDPLAVDEVHPALALLQWAGEVADPPVYAAEGERFVVRGGLDVLMLQGIVDTYILPPIANASSLSFGLDLGGPALDVGALPELPGLEPLLPLVDRGPIDLPAQANVGGADGRTRVVVQHTQDQVEDGHEVAYQLAAARDQVRCFLETALDRAPVVVAPGAVCPRP